KWAFELVAPVDRDGLPALCLDRRARHRPLEAPDVRDGELAVKLVPPGAQVNRQPPVVLRRDEPTRNRKAIDERRERRSHGSHHRPSTNPSSPLARLSERRGGGRFSPAE